MEDPMRTESTRLRSLTRSISKPIFKIAAIGMLNVAMTTSAIGQTTTLPLSIVESASVSGSQQSQIASFASHWSQRATESDAQASARAQTKLIEPLINDRVSISFRRAYSDALGGFFDKLQSNGDVSSTFTALRIAGELGTSRGTRIILDGLESDDAGTRIFAAGRAGRTFRTTATNGPALSANDLNSLIKKLDMLADSSDDQSLVSACIQALGYGCSLPSKDFLQARAMCISAMCDAAGSQLTSGDSDLESRVRLAMLGSGAATNSLLQVGENSNKDGIKSAVALGADMISIALSQVISSTMPGVNDRDLQVALVRSGESLLYFALREYAELNRKPVGNVQQTQFAQLLEAGEDRDFRNQAALLLGPGSPIVTEFGFADDRFVN
jgi:hypothetical protein